ncbi:MAG: hypothetical protein EOS49_19460 [Mesorhizobium sp.]|nr:zinc-binding dehydrogenase [Mesorhizobium sp.]RWE84877.1 MAG: hypothetical protein EOS49_19460 [Mesorhizobium sp.]
MAANGEQLTKIASLIETGEIRPVIDRVFPLEQTNEALAYIEQGRAKGKVVIRLAMLQATIHPIGAANWVSRNS